ncbi:hypothetical protein Anapl_14392 [Anas platyrhynchos]|uniref:Uncharacterized protein n=1 Tax=Anas platyrhynchos TaxID=8839 RepID=R0LNJ5_ANAPL|nr:hypothetical protein Anapl_14392 [Anas platyrhynchos]
MLNIKRIKQENRTGDNKNKQQQPDSDALFLIGDDLTDTGCLTGKELEEDCVNHETKGAQLTHARDDQLWSYFMLQIPPGGVAEKGEKEIRTLQKLMWLCSGNVTESCSGFGPLEYRENQLEPQNGCFAPVFCLILLRKRPCPVLVVLSCEVKSNADLLQQQPDAGQPNLLLTLQGDRIWTTAFSGNGQSSWERDKSKRFYSVGSGGLQQLGRALIAFQTCCALSLPIVAICPDDIVMEVDCLSQMQSSNLLKLVGALIASLVLCCYLIDTFYDILNTTWTGSRNPTSGEMKHQQTGDSLLHFVSLAWWYEQLLSEPHKCGSLTPNAPEKVQNDDPDSGCVSF